MRRIAALLTISTLIVASCSSDDAPAGPETTDPERPTVTLVGIPVVAPQDAVACPATLPITEWEIDAAVLLPGFVLPDGSEQPPATYRLLFQRGAEAGYEAVPDAAAAATDWLPAEFQPEIRSIVLNHLGRNYVFEGEVVGPGAVPGGAQAPCLLPASSAQIVVWYSLQVLDPLGEAEVFWVWQQQGRAIAIEPFEE